MPTVVERGPRPITGFPTMSRAKGTATKMTWAIPTQVLDGRSGG